jgi:hypothetical protein
MRSRQGGGRPSADQPHSSRNPNQSGSSAGQLFTLSRGPHERPLQFRGAALAQVESSGLRAAVYQTDGGSYVVEFARHDDQSNGSGKVAVFDSLDDGLAWFRPGKLTTALYKQLGRWEPEVLDDAAAGDVQMLSADELSSLLEDPNETLSAEYKSWLDLEVPDDAATLAKAAIAMANHGGGVIILGMREQAEDGALRSMPRPGTIPRYNPDDVNVAVNRYAEPEFHCDLAFRKHRESNVEHAFVLVPGQPVPVMSGRERKGVICARKFYIRKPGPRSEEPFSGEEWRSLIDRCVNARREELLGSIRTILKGSAGSVARIRTSEDLTHFSRKAIDRWARVTVNMPVDDPAVFSHGHYQVSIEIQDGKSLPSLATMRNAMLEASQVKHTGWGPFIQMPRPEYEPKIVDGAIEVWLGANVERLSARDPAHCDFWRADASGRMFIIRGYDEDGGHRDAEPGKWTDVTLPVWRVGEIILHAGRVAKAYGNDTSLLVRCLFTGLQGRALTSFEGRWSMFDTRRCSDSEVLLERVIPLSTVEDNLAEALHPLLVPLYERYSFFELPEQLVASELALMMKNRF